MTDQLEATPRFHEAYAELAAGLPPSQLREAHKRLTRCKQPLTDEEVAGEHPRVQACLERIAAAYARNQERSRASSQKRRDATRNPGQPSESADAQAQLPEIEAIALDDEPEPTPEPEPEPVEASPVQPASEPKPAPAPAPVPAPVPVPVLVVPFSIRTATTSVVPLMGSTLVDETRVMTVPAGATRGTLSHAAKPTPAIVRRP